MQTTATEIITFLTELFEIGLSYNSLNVARSALASFVILTDGNTVGMHPLIHRFLKGVYTKRPPTPRYEYIWDVRIVLNYLRKQSPASSLNLKQLTLKLVMLIALVTAQRSQSIHKLRLDEMQFKGSTAVFQITGLIKQSRPGRTGLTVRLPAYPADRRICVYTYLKHYIYKTRKYRVQSEHQQLFISFRRPHGPVSKDTISRWINAVMKQAGIDVTLFKPHSTRAAGGSPADKTGVPVSVIMKTAGWANETTFQKYYNKPLANPKEGFEKILH